jgi:AbrB family looped-hinge helix DNA binding protein
MFYSYFEGKKGRTMRITQKGQVTIPESIRRSAGLLPGTEVEFIEDKDGVRLIPANGRRATPREKRIAEVLDRMRGSATVRMTTEEIMALTRGK